MPLYEESVTIILGKSNDENRNEISYSTITLYDSLIKNYMELLESNKLLSGVKDDLNLDYSVKELDDMIDYTIYDSSQIIKISVKNESDDLAVEICNKLVEDLKDQVYDIYAMDNITAVDKAVGNENMLFICIFNVLHQPIHIFVNYRIYVSPEFFRHIHLSILNCNLWLYFQCRCK